MSLSKKQILAAQDLKAESVDVPEWSGSVRLRLLTAGESAEYLNAIRQLTAGGEIRDFRSLKEKLVALVLVDEGGARLFPEPEDVAHLVGKSAAAIDRLWKAAMHMNGMDKEAAEQIEGN